MTTSLALAAPGTVTTDVEARTISGLAVPYGPAGQTSSGRLTFAAGALRWSESDVGRVKLLREHDQRDVVGYATELRETPTGLHATFRVPDGPAGDDALREASAGLRDGLSVGVQLDDIVATRLRRADGAPVGGAGALREVSLVSVPAFDDARVGAVAAHGAQLVVSAWSDPATPPDPDPDPDPSGDPVPETSTPPATPAPTPGAPAPTPVTPAGTATPAPTPAPPAVAGAALVTGEPATYTFGADSPSLTRDAYHARLHGDADAAGRLARWNAELRAGNPASTLALAAVVTRDDTSAQVVIPPPSSRPLVTAVNLGRPLLSRLPSVPINNAQPFLVPIEGEFDGVALHTEGTPHVPEGTYTLSEQTVAPRAVSGAFRLSRELIDSSNPAIDRLALAAMIRDYRRESEQRVMTTLTTAVTASTTVNRVNELRTQLVNFVGDDDTPASFVVAGRAFVAMLAGDLDADGRPLLSYINPTNAGGTVRPGWTGATVEGVELVRASRVAEREAWIVDADALLVAESAVQTFRFDEVEGPGVIKLALWGYLASAVVRPAGVQRLALPAPTA